MRLRPHWFGLLAFVCFLTSAWPASAQWGYVGFAQVTVDNTSGGKPFPSAQIGSVGHMAPTQAFCQIEGADIRWTIDGTAPTASVGTLGLSGSMLPALNGTAILADFRAIRTDSTNATLNCSFFAGGTLPFREWGGTVGSSGSGSNAAASATGSAVPSSASYTAFNSSGSLVGVSTANRFPVTCDNCGGGSGGTSANDNSAVTFGTTSHTPAGFVFDDTSPNAVTENRTAIPRMSGNRIPYAIIRDAAGNERGANVTANNELLVELGAGSASVGTLGANSGVDIGDVTINNASGASAVNIQDGGNSITIDGTLSGIVPGTGATSLGKAEDAPHASGDTGVLGLFVRQDSQSNLCADGDYCPATINGSGELRVTVGGGTGGTALADDADFTTGTTSFTPTGGLYQSTVTACTDGDTCAFGITTGRALKVAFSNAAGVVQTIASDQTFGTTTYTETTTTGPLVGMVRTDTPAALANTTNEVAPLSGSALGGVYTALASDPCSRLAKSRAVINISSATTTVLVAASASNKLYVCSLAIGPVGGAQNIALVEDATGSCASPDAGMFGGTTTGTGMIFPTSGGLTLGNGLGTVMQTASTNVNVCAISSSSAQTSGILMYVLAP